ncbi:hypothetical protein ACV33M_32690, partial [Pseudomonas aeruginosa]
NLQVFIHIGAESPDKLVLRRGQPSVTLPGRNYLLAKLAFISAVAGLKCDIPFSIWQQVIPC